MIILGGNAQNVLLEPKQDSKKPLWGYVDPSTGKWVVKPAYDAAEAYTQGPDGKYRALVTKGKVQGFLGRDGKPSGAGIVFEKFEPLMKGPNKIVTVKGKYGIISPDGDYVQQPVISSLRPMDADGYIVDVKGKKGFISPVGLTLVAPLYTDITTDGTDVFILSKGNKKGLMSRKGDVLLEPSGFDGISRYGAYWKVKKGDKTGLFDASKRAVLLEAKYADVLEPFSYGGGVVYPVKKKNGKWVL